MASKYDNTDGRERPVKPLPRIGRLLESVEVQSWGNVTSPVIDLLSHRYQRQALTIVTTNLPPAEIEKRYGLRIRDRFREMMERVEFKNESYRKGTGK